MSRGNDIFYTLRHYSEAVDPNSLKFGEERLKVLLIIYGEYDEFSFKGVSVAAW